MLDMTDCGLMAEISSLTDNKELAELIIVELVGAGGPGGLGAEIFFFFLTGGGGGGLRVFIVLGLAPVRGAATGVDISEPRPGN